MPVQALSLGSEIDVWRPRSGIVHSAFEHALNLLIDGELWTVLAATRHDAPFGIRLARCDRLAALEVRAADPVFVRAGTVRAGHQVVDCRAATTWTRSPWGAQKSGLEARLGLVERRAQARAWPGSAALAQNLVGALRTGSDAELAAVVRRSVGHGPGLTPAGDDVLVGVLTVLTTAVAGGEGAAVLMRLVRALAPVLASTTDISRHLLDQAARGLPGRTLHDLGKALYEGAPHEVLADALRSALDTGCTSGADACLGLTAACRLLFLTAERLAPP